MKAGKLTVWSIDAYDGMEPWEEERQEPPTAYKQDAEASANQYHKMTHALYQYEVATDELLTKWRDDEDNQAHEEEWKGIRDGVQEVCENMYKASWIPL